MADQWECRTVAFRTQEQMNEKLNALKAAGWEVVSTKYVPLQPPIPDGIPANDWCYHQATIKRRKQ